jgi:hypothetical protein
VHAHPRWRLTLLLGWSLIGVALGALWAASEQVGQAPWWLLATTPGYPLVAVVPFAPVVAMVLLTLIDPPRLISLGLLCSLVIVIVGLGDLPGVRGIGIVVIALGCSAAALTMAALAGRGRNETSG